ncbi:T3SS (YopN, CesT) and YbjN peptide-binding chaperone 1 [Propionibacteriaceae bacterium Y1685]|uniref:T3SS (YopN, CesT) and YbjN peptide-binding chaperone 1 n=1 Tax=Microlunatus sp. Y1700 TaxID=3418487 RepID=UPI003B7DA385
MNQYTDFDLDRSTAQAWEEFQARLSDVISVIDDSEDMTIGTATAGDDPAPFVRFSSPRRDVVRLEAASNAVLGEDFQLTVDQLQQMADLGWEAPSTDIGPNFWVDGDQEDSDRLAGIAVRALRDVYGVQHPVFLSPDQLAEILQPKPEPLAGSTEFDAEDVVATIPAGPEHLDGMVETELQEMFGHAPLRDSEGDIAIRVGSTMLFVRTSPDGREVIVFATVVHDVVGRSRAAEVLNDLNSDARWVKFQLIRDRVFVTLSVPAHPFVPAHLHQAVRIMSEVADGIDNELATKLDGRTTFDDDGR